MSTQIQTLSFEAIGTSWTIDISDKITKKQLNNIEHLIKYRIEIFDKTYSRFRSDSLVTRIASEAGRFKFPDDAAVLFDLYRQLYKITDGKVTPLIGNLLSDAGYDAGYSLQPKTTLKPAMDWDSVMSYQHPYLITKQPVLLDFGAAGKGYLVDIVGELLTHNGIQSFIIDAGGDILRRDTAAEPARVGLEHPSDPSLVIGVVSLKDESICGSAGNRRQWAGLHHIMDPDIAAPVRSVVATWAVAKTALVADGLATALFFTGIETLQKNFEFECLAVNADMSFHKSTHLNIEMFA